MGHATFSLTFDGVTSVLQTWSPVTAVMETTDGFTKPLAAGSTTTPLKELRDSRCHYCYS